MAVLETLRNLFTPAADPFPEAVTPAPPSTYTIKPLTTRNLSEVLRLNIRCFPNGDSYTKYTFEYLLTEPRTLSYRVVTDSNEIAAFAFAMLNEGNAAHLTTIGVAPEHRRRGLALMLLDHIEKALETRGVGTIMLEVRVSNTGAQELYQRTGYSIVQRMPKYYNDGEDCFLMMKSLY